MSNREKNPDNLKQEPEKEIKNVKFSYFEPFKGIILTLVATVIFLVFPQIITFVFIGNRLIPTFDAKVIHGLWVLIPAILWALFRIGIEIAYLIEKRYTQRLAVITLIGNILAVICGLIVFVSPKIVYWEYSDFIHTYFEDMAAWFSVPLTRILDRPNLIILFIMIVVILIESINMFRRANKVKKNEEDEITTKEVSNAAIIAEAEKSITKADEGISNSGKAETEDV